MLLNRNRVHPPPFFYLLIVGKAYFHSNQINQNKHLISHTNLLLHTLECSNLKKTHYCNQNVLNYAFLSHMREVITGLRAQMVTFEKLN